MRAVIFAFALLASSCAGRIVTTVPTQPAPAPVLITGRDQEFAESCRAIYIVETGRDITAQELKWCLLEAQLGRTGDELQVIVHNFDESKSWRERPRMGPIPAKRAFYESYQANFGGIELPGCGLRNNILFDPQLLPMWLYDKPCFERAMNEHAVRNDTVVVVSPAICYHEGYAGACADIWHQPNIFAAFLKDIRSRSNMRDENFEAHVLMVQGEHEDWYPLLKYSEVGVPDMDKEAHVMRDMEALAAVTQDLIAGTAPCWECRHQRDFVTAGGYERIGKAVARLWPKAWHGQHLIKESSSWSSWRCDPKQVVIGGFQRWQLPSTSKDYCGMENEEKDDPNRGNEPRAWDRCVQEQWCDGLMYQAPDGPKFLTPIDGNAAKDWKDRWREITDRLGKGEHGWAKVEVIFWESIYDRFMGRATERLLKVRCAEAQAIFPAPCGSASVRMGQ